MSHVHLTLKAPIAYLEHKNTEGRGLQMDTLSGSLHRAHWLGKDSGYRDESLLL